MQATAFEEQVQDTKLTTAKQSWWGKVIAKFSCSLLSSTSLITGWYQGVLLKTGVTVGNSLFSVSGCTPAGAGTAALPCGWGQSWAVHSACATAQVSEEAKQGQSGLVNCTKPIGLSSPWGHGWSGWILEEGKLEGAGEDFVVCMISGPGSWDVNGCGWSALVKADGKGRSGSSFYWGSADVWERFWFSLWGTFKQDAAQ